MKMKLRKTKSNLLTLSIFTIIIFGIFSTAVSASSSYQSTLVKGTDDFIVNQYNDAAWKTTVNNSSNPSFWFEGDANITGAKSKTTILGWNDIVWQTWDVFTSLFMSEYYSFEDLLILLNIMDSLGYNETTINTNYTESYSMSYGIRAVWNFTDGAFLEDPSYSEGILVFKDPLDFKTMLDDYDTIAAEINKKLFFPFTYLTFPNITADEFLWQLALNGFAVASPQSAYLNDLIEELGCENVTSNGNTLIFERYGETTYTVEITYGAEGTMSTVSVKTADETIIFQINSTNSEWMFFTIITVISICIVVITIVLILRKRKINKLRKN